MFRLWKAEKHVNLIEGDQSYQSNQSKRIKMEQSSILSTTSSLGWLLVFLVQKARHFINFHHCPDRSHYHHSRFSSFLATTFNSFRYFLSLSSYSLTILFILFGWWSSRQVQAIETYEHNSPSLLWPTTITAKLSSPSSPSFSLFRCNWTKFPHSNGCHPSSGASCDPESRLCICSWNKDHDDGQNDDVDDDGGSVSEHHHCLPARRLEQSCQHSAQCYSLVLGSGCFRSKTIGNSSSNHNDQDKWQCSCPFGYKDEDDGNDNNENISQCKTMDDQEEEEEQGNGNLYKRHQHQRKCNETPGFLWIPMLRRCVASQIHYSMRVGRAGGGRGGGRGGSVGRATGSRAWFNRHARSSASINWDASIYVVLANATDGHHSLVIFIWAGLACFVEQKLLN